MKTLATASLLVIFVTTACHPIAPPSGACTGSAGATPLNVTIDSESEFFRDFEIVDTDTSLHLSYGGDTLAFEISLAAEPSATKTGAFAFHEGDRTDNPDGYIEEWSTNIATTTAPPPVTLGSITFTKANANRQVGHFELTFSDGTTTSCTFDVPSREALKAESGDGDGNHHHHHHH